MPWLTIPGFSRRRWRSRWRAVLAVFGEGADGAEKLPGEYYSLLVYWQAGLTAAYLLWAVVQSVLRRKTVKKFR